MRRTVHDPQPYNLYPKLIENPKQSSLFQRRYTGFNVITLSEIEIPRFSEMRKGEGNVADLHKVSEIDPTSAQVLTYVELRKVN